MEAFNPFQLNGRIGRMQFLGFALLWALIIWFTNLLFMSFEGSRGTGSGGGLGLFVLYAVYFVAKISYGVRRLHDFDASGLWYLVVLIPGGGFVLMLTLLFVPGTPGENRYGVRLRPA